MRKLRKQISQFTRKQFEMKINTTETLTDFLNTSSMYMLSDSKT